MGPALLVAFFFFFPGGGFCCFFSFGWVCFLTSKYRCVKMVLTETAYQITLTSLVHVLHRQSTDLFRAGESGEEGGSKTNAHWLTEGKIVHSLCTVVFFNSRLFYNYTYC